MFSFLFMAVRWSEEKRNIMAQIYVNYRNYMYKIAFDILKDDFMTEDAIHEAIFKISRYAENIKLDHDTVLIDEIAKEDLLIAKTKNLIGVVTKYCCIDLLRKQKKIDLNEFYIEDYSFKEKDLPSPKLNVDSIAIARETVQKIVDCINMLRQIYSDPLKLKYIYWYSTKEISDLLKIKKDNVWVRLSRGRNLLINKLTGEGLHDGKEKHS